MRDLRDRNSYSVPWRLIGESVQVVVLADRVIIRHAGHVVADHALCRGRRQRIVDRKGSAGFEGPMGAERKATRLPCSAISARGRGSADAASPQPARRRSRWLWLPFRYRAVEGVEEPPC
ncbi:Mu transposase domain-containing protein [Mesorhizobium sp. ORM6]